MMTSMLQEVDGMASVVIQEPPSSPLHMAVFANKVQTLIRRCMVSICSILGCTLSPYNIQQTFPVQPSCRCPREHVPDRVLVELKGVLVDSLVLEQEVDALLSFLFLVDLDMQTPDTSRWREVRDLERWREGGIWYHFQVDQGHCAPPPPGLGFTLFQSPAGTSLGFSSFRTPPPPGTTGSSILHQLISQTFSSDEEERTDDTDDVQHLGFGHRIGKKTTRFTPSDWP
ncbi:hypothetical protein M9H77_04525 [Catharanthus roseus]|uniref:Uncharacterized protein n=1 Tax=Catharanthus roseus TaxID=4058 RepID=A0ACC0CEJ7_CATRO|nr:hypothetical protein M9H77_04525 [Catharanthus roseus]